MASKKRSTPKVGTIVGFKKIETSLSGFWKPEGAGEAIQGIVGPAVEVKGHDGALNTFFTVQLTTVDVGPIYHNDKEIDPAVGMIVGVGGKMLRQFLAAREGVEVLLIYKGLGKAKPGQSAPKLFDTYERESDQT